MRSECCIVLFVRGTNGDTCPVVLVIRNVGCVTSGRVGPLQLSQLEMSVKEHRVDSEQRMVRVDAQLNKAQLDLEHNHKLATLHFTFSSHSYFIKETPVRWRHALDHRAHRGPTSTWRCSTSPPLRSCMKYDPISKIPVSGLY